MTEIILGDCLEVMKSFPDNHFTGIFTDPPYGLHFMGKDWDKYGKFLQRPRYDGTRSHCNMQASNAGVYDESRNDEFQSFITQFGIEALRIVKPGGHMLMCGAPRRYHRQACGLEDAGWEIRDCLCWLFGSGFPKSQNHFGAEGFGTALKPAYEPIILAMKPLDGTFKQNYEKWGVGGLNIDTCRIPLNGDYKSNGRPSLTGLSDNYDPRIANVEDTKGRWPTNLLLDDEAAALLDEQSGVLTSGKLNRANIIAENKTYGAAPRQRKGLYTASSGGASRFFYCAKTSSSERNEGLEALPDKEGGIKNSSGRGYSESDPNKLIIQKNNHPTVKPLALMRYLITLISPPTNALILDPFAGSGSTIVAAEQLGIAAIGIEKQPEYCEIARARLKHAQSLPKQMDLF